MVPIDVVATCHLGTRGAAAREEESEQAAHTDSEPAAHTQGGERRAGEGNATSVVTSAWAVVILCRTAADDGRDRIVFDLQRDAVRNMLRALCKKRAAIEIDEATR